jgi:hypothetical protein
MIDKDADEFLAAFSEWEAAADALLSKRQLREMLRGDPLPAESLQLEMQALERLHARWLELSAPLVTYRA